MNRTHPPTYPRRESDGWLDALGRLIALAVFAVSVVVMLAVIR